MPTERDLKETVSTIFHGIWDHKTIGRKVPEPADLRLNSNHGIRIDATVLYADIEASTQLVDAQEDWHAAELYKAYLHCAASIIKGCGGVVTAYDGDRVMGVFIGDSKNTSAIKAALRINWAVDKIINPEHADFYKLAPYVLKHTIGVDTSDLLAARIGVRNDNDIVWVGRAANHAAKLCAEQHEHSLRITEAVFERLNNVVKFYDGKDLWEKLSYSATTKNFIHTSNWMFNPDFEPTPLI